MAVLFENLGLSVLEEDDDLLEGMIGYAFENGRAILGYYGDPYVNHEFGSVQFVMRTELNHEAKTMEFKGLDTHASGNAVWEMRCDGIDLPYKTMKRTEKRCAFSYPQGNRGFLVVNVVNADVIPSYLEGDFVKMQMVAFPEVIEFYEDGEAYEATIEPNDLGKKNMIAEGALLPVGLITNRNVNKDDDEEPSDWLDNITLLRAVVKDVFWRKMKINDDERNVCLNCRVDTDYGELDLVYAVEQVKENQREYMRPGATVVAQVVLSGDVAIYEYDKGIVKNHENNLRVVRSVFEGENPDRLQFLLTDETIYHADTIGKAFVGKDEILDRLKHVQSCQAVEILTSFANIVEVKDGEEELPHQVGSRCIVLAEEERSNYISLAFIECDENGNISLIRTTEDSRYVFHCEDPANGACEDAFDFTPHKSAEDAMIARAIYHDFLDIEDVMDVKSELCEERYTDAQENIEKVLSCWEETKAVPEVEHLENLFGYFFAKAVETKLIEKLAAASDFVGCEVTYSPTHAWEGEVNCELDEENQKKLTIAFKYGKQFFKDYSLHKDEASPNRESLVEALVFVQRLGFYVSETLLKLCRV